MAGVGPGLTISAVCGLAMALFAMVIPHAAGRAADPEDRTEWPMRWRALGRVWPPPALIGVVLGACIPACRP